MKKSLLLQLFFLYLQQIFQGRTSSKKRIMNYKKLFFNVIIVALVVTMCVGFTSCEDDDIEPLKPDYSSLIIGTWKFSGLPVGYTIDFNDDGTYSYDNPEQDIGAGIYQIVKILYDQEVKLGSRDGDPDKCVLLFVEVYPNDIIDRLCVYYLLSTNVIAVDFYSKNQLLTGSLYALVNKRPKPGGGGEDLGEEH